MFKKEAVIGYAVTIVCVMIGTAVTIKYVLPMLNSATATPTVAA